LIGTWRLLVRNSTYHYGQIARLLHWTSVGLLVAAVYSSSLIGSLDEGAARNALIAEHVSYGLTLLCVMCARFLWRQSNPNPIHSYSIYAAQKRIAISVHWFIYAVIIFQSCIGVAQVVTTGQGVSLFGVQLSASLAAQDIELSERLNDIHLALANLIYWVLGLHITAAIYHQIFGVLDPEDQNSVQQ